LGGELVVRPSKVATEAPAVDVTDEGPPPADPAPATQ
jgi:hypothetical protein